MEAIGLAASVITLIGATSLTSSMLTRLWGLHGTPIYILTALNDLRDFQTALALVQSAFEELDGAIPDAVVVEVHKLLSHAADRIGAFNDFLKQEVLREYDLEASSMMPKIRKRAKFKEIIGQAQCQIATLQQELLSIKMSLSLALGVANL